MVGLMLVPAVLSLVVLAAHFLRSGNVAMVAVALMLAGVVAVRRRWAARLIQVALLLGALEWVRTLMDLARSRSETGQPVLRLILILGGVALVTALSSLVFSTARLRTWYGTGRAPVREGG